MTERSDTKTSQNTTTSESVITEAKTKSEPSPTAMMLERSDATISQETPTSKSVESSTTDATSKPMKSPRTTMSDTTTSQETTPSESVTAEARTKSEPIPTTTMTERSDATTSQENPTSTCSQYGSHLVFIESQEEQDFIVENIKEDHWIGLTGSNRSDARALFIFTFKRVEDNHIDD
ncbi:300 kDa antigen AG231-like [Strongylocentrotus purpuratus]|uniref:C-type lectin domain-containing protein n=1 Tax=Strongylocentrotus purpuratus TaxID=7668 RepID=A0A7M7NUF6_STRPU|nr:300 kDa antigen AG231-like [Strongylocentrotus purpuratus]